MSNIFSKIFFFLRYVLIIIAFLLIFWGIMFTYQRLEKPLSESINVILPFVLVFIVFIANLFVAKKACSENLLFNFKNHFKNFNSKYNKLYLIHGDLHYNNLIYTGNNLIAIDPSPKIASFAIEVAKFIENELYININLIEKKLDFIVKIFRFNIISEEELLEGLFIDSCRRTFDSYLKGDDEQTFIRGIKVNNKIFNYLEGRKSNGF